KKIMVQTNNNPGQPLGFAPTNGTSKTFQGTKYCAPTHSLVPVFPFCLNIFIISTVDGYFLIPTYFRKNRGSPDSTNP
ncbi:MAG: hypothetical protein JXB48_16105, partial [Candidatus Latescibacteria bacterium]|nr:hypothetical protein [Candidatus Latescibacterota bacterium]